MAESTPKKKVHDDQFHGTKLLATSQARIANIATINKIYTIIRDEQIPRRPSQTISPIDLANYDCNNQQNDLHVINQLHSISSNLYKII